LKKLRQWPKKLRLLKRKHLLLKPLQPKRLPQNRNQFVVTPAYAGGGGRQLRMFIKKLSVGVDPCFCEDDELK
jgi:hypothetical protein